MILSSQHHQKFLPLLSLLLMRVTRLEKYSFTTWWK